MQKQIEDLKRRAEQGSQQLQGEVQEMELESLLAAKFPRDTIQPVPKGEFGGDVLQRVVGPLNQICGTILWECKRTKNWTDGWLPKLREDQRAAIQEWIDALDEWPADGDPQVTRERELLRVRSRDVLEHVERVLTHVRRLESSAESAVQMHFSALGHRTNSIMRTLTVLTAIFLPLNLITGIFGMNFEWMPLIKNPNGFWEAESQTPSSRAMWSWKSS